MEELIFTMHALVLQEKLNSLYSQLEYLKKEISKTEKEFKKANKK